MGGCQRIHQAPAIAGAAVIRAVKAWWNRPAEPWQFWLPRSGNLGGTVAGFVLFVAVYAALVLYENLAA